MKRYAIWDKRSQVITHKGQVYSPEQWMEKHPAAALDSVVVVCAAGEINGGFFGTLDQMRLKREGMGADFSECTTDEEVLEVIEAFDAAQATKAAEAVSAEERIAAALEAQNLMAMEDVTE